jgi:drug/metabolite transporter (DMT)-like permease
MTHGLVLCVLTSVFWALSSLLVGPGVRHLGARWYNPFRLIIGSVSLAMVAGLSGELTWPSESILTRIVASAVIGLLLGDAFLFGAFRILNARRATLVFAMNVPFTALFAAIFLNESLSTQAVIGGCLTLGGIAAAVTCRAQAASGRRDVDKIEGSLAKGVTLALVAALLQSIGLLILKPVFSEGAQPLNVAALRFLVAAAWGGFPFLLSRRFRSGVRSMPRHTLGLSLAGILCGTTLGFSLYTTGIGLVPVAYAALLTSLSPLFVLPIISIVHRKAPSIGAWAGALLSVLGLWMTLAAT